jgi:hypothetical protein
MRALRCLRVFFVFGWGVVFLLVVFFLGWVVECKGISAVEQLVLLVQSGMRCKQRGVNKC